jgi:hypothetical protein
MNFARVGLAGVSAWVVSMLVGFVVNDILLKGVFQANAAALRPEAEIMAKLPLGFGFTLIGFLAFAYAYAKGYEGTSGMLEGIRYGMLVAIMVVSFAIVWYYVTVPIDGTMAAAMMIDYFVEWSLYGAIVGAIYKPLPTAAGARV